MQSVWGVEHGVISKAERSNSDVARYRRTTPEQKDEMKRRGKRYANVANAAVLGSIGMGGKSIHHNLKSARLEGQANDALWGGHGDWRKAEALRARARVQGIKGAKSGVGMGALMAGAATTFFIGGQHNKYRLRRYPNTEA